LNIAIIVEKFPVISETFITNKVVELCKRGHTITVITHRTSGNAALSKLYQLDGMANLRIVAPVIPRTGLQWTSLLTRKPGIFLKALSTPGAFKASARNYLLSTLFRNKPFDIIHFEFSAIALLYTDVLATLQAPTIVSCRGTAEKVKPLTVPGRKEEMERLFARVTAIHCVSQDMAQTIAPFCAFPEKIFINRPSIDVAHFAPTATKPGSDTITILSVGRFTFQKNYLTGLLAMQRLKKRFPAFQWCIVGEGPQTEEVTYHIHALGLQNEVKLLGRKNKEEVLELYKEADVFLLCSVYEGIANAVLEAMAMELPVVSTRCGGMEEVITNGVDGMLADVYAFEQVEAHLYALCTGSAARQKMGKLAREQVTRSFTLQRQTDQFEAVYKKLVGTKR